MEKIRKRKEVTLHASAKINLFLDILSKREDGYHNIRTIFSEIDLYDNLNFTLTKNDTVQILSQIDFVSVEKNLIYKVAVFIKNKYNVKDGVEIEMEKKIPIAAGLGGGSSDAASTIKALNLLWNLNLSDSDMHDIAALFGSDINFFLQGGTALGEGRGEQIKPVKEIDIENIFLVNPGFEISSKEAYANIDITSENENWEHLIQTENTKYCFNKLEKGIKKIYPEIENITSYLKKNGATNAILSGSGATVIGFCPNRKIAEKFSQYYSRKKYWNCLTKTIKRRTK